MEEKSTEAVIFLDASVLVAATLSSTGGSFRIIMESAVRGFQLITSRYAYRETERTLAIKYPEKLIELQHVISHVVIVPDASQKVVVSVLPLIDFKDAPILAAALVQKAHILLTLDRIHFIENQTLQKSVSPLNILTPGNFIKKYF